MSRRTIEVTDQLYDYILANSVREKPLFKRLRDVTSKMPMAGMQISPEQGQFMQLLVELIGRHGRAFPPYFESVLARARD